MKDKVEQHNNEALSDNLTSMLTAMDINHNNNHPLQVLFQFINYLSKACKGLNLELDNKLANLRSLFIEPNKIPQTFAELSHIQTLLKQHDNHVKLQLEVYRQQLISSLKQLDEHDAITHKQQLELSYLKKVLNTPFHTFLDYIHQLEQLITIYESIINHHSQSHVNNQITFRTLAIEVTQILSEIHFHQHQKDKINLIKETLIGDFTLTELLSAYQSILRLLQENIDTDQSASQAFLFTLEDSLLAMTHMADNTHDHTENQFVNNTELNKSMCHKVNIIENHLIHIDDIDELKTKLIEQVSQLHLELNQRQAQEAQSIKVMQRSFAAMKKQMDGLNKEIVIYKEGLFEQQKFHLIDPLTQLPNRAALEERMSLEYRHYQRHKQALWVIIADIDHFKSINDNFGHSTGDKTLQVISMAFKNALKESEFVARFGGEEFVLLIPELSVNHLDALLNRLRKKIKNIPFKFKNQRITVTVSIGAAKILENETIQDTFERADTALYRAKNESRDKVIIDL